MQDISGSPSLRPRAPWSRWVKRDGARIFFIVGALLAAAMTAPTAQAEFGVNATGLSLHGEITREDHYAFGEMLQTQMLLVPRGHPIALTLDAESGDLRAALKIARLITVAQTQYGARIAARVPSQGRCHTACLAVFAAAETRLSAADAVFAVTQLETLPTLRDATERETRRHYVELFLETIGAADPDFAQHIVDRRLLSAGDVAGGQYRATEMRKRFSAFLAIEKDSEEATPALSQSDADGPGVL
ncbi:MAG: hypothetical protein QNJ84_18185 [Alphaproteobacteria bacterium]|nr:hypothetical protein [Alphaproteobacteria bacterium]